MWRVTFVGQDKKKMEPFARELSGEGYRTVVCLPAEMTTASADGPSPDAVVVDATSTNGAVGLPNLLHDIRETAAAPTIALLEESHLSDCELPRGIDDFLVLPATAVELAARVRQLLRRHAHLEDDNTLCCGDLVVNLASREVFLAGRPVTLAYKEYELLRFLLSNRGTVFTREALLSNVWGYDFYGGTRTVDVHIRRLRSKIEGPRHAFIETVRNVGYRFHPTPPS
ncbi:MAG: response regulator transcription factor [Dehalococcoidia bacterium]|nr:MAG: response regulator transcription factor [Dehalococcoidia bacterium]